MVEKFDIHFNVYSDTPPGKDPDAHSPNLKKYHKILWSKNLPNGQRLHLDDDYPGVLHHKSNLGEFLLSSDSIAHTYSKTKSLKDIIDKISEEEILSEEKVRNPFAPCRSLSWLAKTTIECCRFQFVSSKVTVSGLTRIKLFESENKY